MKIYKHIDYICVFLFLQKNTGTMTLDASILLVGHYGYTMDASDGTMGMKSKYIDWFWL